MKISLRGPFVSALLVTGSVFLLAGCGETVTTTPPTKETMTEVPSTIASSVPSAPNPIPATGYDVTVPIVATDYSQPNHWLNVPPANDKAVDVFYLYPTSWQRMGESAPHYAEIDNPTMLKGSKLVYGRSAIAFEDIANIYAPYYRQDDAGPEFLAMSLEQQKNVVKGIPLTDGMAAFDYYIKNYNQGRPFILASHSQGSNVMIFILADYMKAHPDVYKRMVAAYVIGWTVDKQYLADNPHLKFAEGGDDTGVIISYNTEAPTIPGVNPTIKPGAIAINPINWSREEILAPASENLGSLAMNPDGTPVRDANGKLVAVKNYADAKVDKTKGVLICSTVGQEKLAVGLGPGIYHSYDYPFYFFNLKENAARRVKNFLNK